jgi:hypothetical protein
MAVEGLDYGLVVLLQLPIPPLEILDFLEQFPVLLLQSLEVHW